MINSIVWCMVIVTMNYGGEAVKAETAAKGIVKEESGELLTIDFSDYASDQNYIGDYSNIDVFKDKCIKE